MSSEKLRRDYLDTEKMLVGLPGFGKPVAWADDTWIFDSPAAGKRVIVSLDLDSDPDGHWWIHASISYRLLSRVPSYGDLKQLHAAVFGEGFAYQCFVPPAKHVNIRSNALHLFGRYDGANVLPDFGRHGTI